jgi:peptidoglycan/LPS O-acetylase OafA/YrhL
VPNTARTIAYVPALDGLRGVAVAGVLAFHGGVAVLGGGFLGVDAFFVLSGFLITALLLAEHRETGRIALARFWARRARRLLPALLLLLATVLGVSRFLLPPEELPALRADALAAVAYAANWRLLYRDGGYFAETAAPSPLQHTWSLAIEEQFYLVWPLLVLALLVATRRAGARTRRGVVLGACLAGAAGSAATAALLGAHADPDRLYYGTDTRAAALLLGAALAAVLAGRPTTSPADKTADEPADKPADPAGRGRHRVLGALALVGAVGTGWLWVTADGTDAWLYPGGLLAAGLGVTAVIAHAVVSPGSPTARVLAVAPLVLLGRISYGVYLWHWPLFGWLNAERTGQVGWRLLALRCAATLAVATVSYLLLERPIRQARWFRAPWRTPALAGAATAAVVAVALWVTVTPPVPPAPAVDVDQALSTAVREPRRDPHREPAPVDRPGRKPGDRPRITFFGDSVAWSLATYLPPQKRLDVSVRGVPGCGIARLPDIRYIGKPHTNYPGCETWDKRWRRNVKSDDPDVAVVLLDRWELMDRRLNGRYQHIGDPEFDAYLRKELDTALTIVASRRAHVVVLTAPYTRRAERPDGGLWPEDQPERVDAWNVMLRDAARRHRATVLDLNAHVCPDGEFTWRVGGVRVRSDGLHFTPEGVRRHIAPWLLPEVARLAVQPPGS